MPCYKPIKAWKSKYLHESGKNKITFKRSEGIGENLPLPCGQCIGCKLEKSRQWAVRCVHESKMHKENCMLTLTYNNENLPPGGSLKKRDMQLFVKRLRKQIKVKVRYIYCGEYGDQFQRPHYHMCLFGYNFRDRVAVRETADGTHYNSAELRALWGKGKVECTELNFKTAAYVARYITKKVNGPWKEGHYGERDPEFLEASRKPGIGATFYEEFKTDIYPSDECIVNNKSVKPPRFYDKKFENDGGDLKNIKEKRIALAKENQSHQTPERLKVRERVKNLTLKTLKRRFEDEDPSSSI